MSATPPVERDCGGERVEQFRLAHPAAAIDVRLRRELVQLVDVEPLEPFAVRDSPGPLRRAGAVSPGHRLPRVGL